MIRVSHWLTSLNVITMLESPYLFRLMRKRILARTNLGIPILIVSRKSKENVLILRSSSLVLEEHFLDILAKIKSILAVNQFLAA